MRVVPVAAVVVAGAVAVACGGGGDEARVCATDAGSTACLVDGSGGETVRLEAEGFQPRSEIGIAGLKPGDGELGEVGKIGGNGELEDEIAYEGPAGQIPELVVTVQGTSRSGTPVLLTLRRPAG